MRSEIKRLSTPNTKAFRARRARADVVIFSSAKASLFAVPRPIGILLKSFAASEQSDWHRHPYGPHYTYVATGRLLYLERTKSSTYRRLVSDNMIIYTPKNVWHKLRFLTDTSLIAFTAGDPAPQGPLPPTIGERRRHKSG